ncbi:ABC transporter ATP-binding protein [Roseiarcaceae bacterium H3SJ34-1]|uniref:ABC transporter ATP-binding protein n=1 Tax=Terripilifer ovatus TaxID=3032367 RepID=UPI003AB95609|nr:ABC transporter ATP-binding protein [Roseiarcaceae bacterium H3SJ34-1]
MSSVNPDAPAPQKDIPKDDDADISQFLEEEEAEATIQAKDLGFMFRFLLPYLRPYWKHLALVGVLLTIQTIFNASFPLATQYLIDQGLIERDWNALVMVLIFLSTAAIVVSVVAIGNDYIYSRVFSNVVKDIRISLFEQLQKLPMPFFQRTPSGNILSRFSGDIVASETMLVQFIPSMIVPMLEVIYATALMFYFNIWLGLIGLLVFPMILAGPSIFSRMAFALSYDKRSREADILTAAQENVQAQPVVKAFGLRKRSLANFRDLNVSWTGYAFRVYFFSSLAASSAYMGVYIIHIVIIILGAYWAFNGEMSIGTLVAFESMFVSMGYALTDLTQFVPTLAQATGSMQHLNEVFEEKPSLTDAPDAIVLQPMQQKVAFENVSFAYDGGNVVLNAVNLDVAKGSYVAVVGRSGSGKSTILSLLMRFYDPTSGRVAIDGVDIRSVTQDSLHAQIGIVFQESFLFNASILDNIRMGKQDATIEEVEAALRTAEIWETVAALPDGVGTMVGERGGKLSGGQRQRVAIARALVRNPAILVLDEATSALDAIAEAALNITLQRIARERTVINVTHRLSNVTNADMIVVIDAGNIVETGTHGELLARNGRYAHLWRTQQSDGTGSIDV